MNTNTLEIKLPLGNRRINTEQIIAIQTVDRSKVNIYMSDSLIKYAIGNLSKLFPFLPNHFHYASRNCIVNYHAIKEYNLKTNEVTVVCNDEKVTFKVSRNNMKELITWIKQINCLWSFI